MRRTKTLAVLISLSLLVTACSSKSSTAKPKAAASVDLNAPRKQGGTVTKLGIDATRHEGDRPDWELARPPEVALARARQILHENQLV